MSKVLVLGTDKQPLTPVHPAGARYLLKEGKAAVYRRYPFTIILEVGEEMLAGQPLMLFDMVINRMIRFYLTPGFTS